jgi:hypothetical protein
MLVHSTVPPSQVTPPPNALEYAQCVNTAYAVFDANESNLNPSLDDYKNVPASAALPGDYVPFLNIQMTDFFGDSTTPKYYGFFAHSQSEATTIIVLRGTQTAEEWWDDFHWEPVPLTFGSNSGNVAYGFLHIYQTMTVTMIGTDSAPLPLKNVIEQVNVSGSWPGLTQTGNSAVQTSYVICAHSLGSALATLLAADFAVSSKINPALYTLASPRTGDVAFANFFDGVVNTSYRIYNWPDVVPRFPKDPLDNYQHVKGGFEVDSLDYNQVKWTLLCFHSVLTYLFLLGAPASILGACTSDW